MCEIQFELSITRFGKYIINVHRKQHGFFFFLDLGFRVIWKSTCFPVIHVIFITTIFYALILSIFFLNRDLSDQLVPFAHNENICYMIRRLFGKQRRRQILTWSKVLRDSP